MKKMYKNLTLLCCVAILSFTNGVFAQDDCVDATALVIDGGVIASDNTLTTDENDATDNIDAACWGADGLDGDIWFSFVGTGGFLDIETSNLDTQIAVYDACGGLVVACDDDSGIAFASLITDFCSDLGVTYFLEVEGWNGNEGPFNVEVRTSATVSPIIYCDDVTATNYTDPTGLSSCYVADNTTCVYGVVGCADPTALNFDIGADSCTGLIGGTDTSCCTYPPVNDECVAATVVNCGDLISDSNLTATSGNEVLAPSCGPAIEGPGVWYTLVGDGQEWTASTCGSTLDTRIHVFSGACGAYTCEGGNDDSCGLQSEVSWITSIGVDYYVHVSGWNGAIGNFDISFTCAAPSCVPPLNDQCGNAFPLADAVLFTGSNVCAQANDAQPGCDPFGVINGVWYIWNSGANNAMTVDFAAAAAPVDSAADFPAIAIFSGNCANPTELFCSNGAVAGANLTGLSLGTDYYVIVWTGDDVSEGEFDLTVTGGVSGCATVGACNYDATATIDDGSCDLSCIGCNDVTAINYDAAAINGCDGLGGTDCCIIAGCVDAPITFGLCYDSSATQVYTFTENNPGEGVTLLINAGTIEAGWDILQIYDGADNTGAVLNVQIDGDFAGQAYQSSGASISLAVISDTSVSCVSGSQTAFDISVFCGFEVVLGCTDPLAVNFDPAANTDDGSCHFDGCIDPLACNYEPLALNDIGDCCTTNCTTVTVTDTFGDGGTTVILFDDLGTNLGSVTVTADEATGSFCIPDGCIDVSITVDGFSLEAGVTITTQDGVIYDAPTGSILASEVVVVDFGSTGLCDIAGCMDAAALNYNPDANQDCLEVTGGSDTSCCNYPVANNDCDGAFPIVAGVQEAWDSNNSSDSGYNCSPTLTNDVWYSYTPACDLEVSITSASNQGGEVAIWEGDCAGGLLTLVACAPNAGFIGVEVIALLEGGTTYYIQTGSNSDFGAQSTGTLDLVEGVCRGCIYDAADNYDAGAAEDDGSCIFPDCSCPGDFTNDGFVTVADLTGFLGAFGSACP